MRGVPLLVALLLGGSPVQEVPVPSGPDLPRGELVENLTSPSDPTQRYALYVPTGYQPDRPVPVLLLMDPRGRAAIPARLFRDAAETYGYLLISSYNTASDGPIEPNLAALQAMWTDVHQRFTVDDRRVYMVGFSGTARVATLVASRLPGRFAGVVGTGAGYAPDQPPARDQAFLYHGSVGDLDFNYVEVQALEDTLVELGLPHRVHVFSGGHRWMPADVARTAVEWLELRAMQAGVRQVDAVLIERWWERDRAEARALEAAGRVLDAARRYAAMARDFEGLRDVEPVARTAHDLSRSQQARDQARERQAEFVRTSRYMDDAMQELADAFPPGASRAERPIAGVRAALDLTRLTKAAADTGTADGQQARRLLANLGTQLSFYLPQEAAASGEHARAAFYLTLATDISPGSAPLWYELAAAQARAGQRRLAIDALGRAVEAGFRDQARAAADPAFASLRDDADFKGLLGRMGGV